MIPSVGDSGACFFPCQAPERDAACSPIHRAEAAGASKVTNRQDKHAPHEKQQPCSDNMLKPVPSWNINHTPEGQQVPPTCLRSKSEIFCWSNPALQVHLSFHSQEEQLLDVFNRKVLMTYKPAHIVEGGVGTAYGATSKPNGGDGINNTYITLQKAQQYSASGDAVISPLLRCGISTEDAALLRIQPDSDCTLFPHAANAHVRSKLHQPNKLARGRCATSCKAYGWMLFSVALINLNISVAAQTQGTVASGKVVEWGHSYANETISEPYSVKLQGGVIAIAAGDSHNLALLEDGSVVAWGNNQLNQCNVPDVIQGHVKAISAVSFHSLALLKNGSVVIWGHTCLDTNCTQTAKVPDAIQGNVIAISAGGSDDLALLSDGSVASWSENLYTSLPVPDAAKSNIVAVYTSVGQSFALTSEGVLVVWGDGEGSMPDTIQGHVTAVSGSELSSMVLLDNGSVVVWGGSYANQTNVPAAAMSYVVAISDGHRHALALLNNGTVVAWGDNERNQTDVPEEIQGKVTAIAAGPYHNLAIVTDTPVISLTPPPLPPPILPPPPPFLSSFNPPMPTQATIPTTGKVVMWGHSYGNETVPEPYSIKAQGSVTAVSAGDSHNLALLQDGTVVAWGNNDDSQCNVPDAIQGQVKAICASGSHSLALLSSGAVVAWGSNLYNQSIVPDVAQRNVIAIAAGAYHSLALLDSGRVIAWGDNKLNQSTVPSTAQSNVIAICAGKYHSLALLKTGAVVGWGTAGNGNSFVVPYPAQNNVVAMSASEVISMVLFSSGSVYVWGDNAANEVRVPDIVQGHAVAVSAGMFHALALLDDGTVVAWGQNDRNQTSIPDGIQGKVIAIAAGPYHNLAVVADTPVISLTPPSPSPSIVSPASTTSSHSSTVGIAVGVAAAGVACLVVVVLIVWYRRRRTGRRSTENFSKDGKAPLADVEYHGDSSIPPLATIITTTRSTGTPVKANHESFPSQLTHTEPSSRLSGVPTLASEPTSSTPRGIVIDRDTDPGVTVVLQKRVLGTLRIAWSDIELGQQLGQGGFGTVYLGAWQGNRVAVKMLNTEHLSEQAREALHQEVLMMCELRHPCIAPAYGLVDEGDKHALVMRYYKRGTLADAMRTSAYQQLDLVPRLKIALQVATGILRLHEAHPKPIIHGDLKTSNILLDDDGSWRVVIADFGLACSVCTSRQEGSRTAVGMTVSISPPEVLEHPHAPRTLAVDSYAFAIVLLEIVQGAPLYRNMRAHEVVSAVKQGRRAAIPASVPDDVAALIQACWAQDPAARPGFKECTDKLKQSINEHSCASTRGHDFLNTTAVMKTENTTAWY